MYCGAGRRLPDLHRIHRFGKEGALDGENTDVYLPSTGLEPTGRA